jgi:hypothetical protein
MRHRESPYGKSSIATDGILPSLTANLLIRISNTLNRWKERSAMYKKWIKTKKVRFAIKPTKQVEQSLLAGSFTNWKPLPMKKQEDGTFAIVLDVPSGTHEYKFVMDGQWMLDPDNGAWAVSTMGTVNSVVRLD